MKDSDDLIREALGLAAAQVVEARFNELGEIALGAAEAGTAFCYVRRFRDTKRPDSDSRAIAFVMNGPIPDDLLGMIEDYVRGAAQDFTSGNPNLKIIDPP